MQRPVRWRIGLLAAALWWGSLTALGLVVVPLLFVHLPSLAMAGAMAAKLFSAQTWVGSGCAMLMLLVFKQKEALVQSTQAQAAMKLIVAGLLLAWLVEFGVAPRIIAARADGGNLRLWHGLGSALLLGQWLCASAVLWRLSASAAAPVPGKSG